MFFKTHVHGHKGKHEVLDYIIGKIPYGQRSDSL